MQLSPNVLNFEKVFTLQEQYLYGSKRLGVRRPKLLLATAPHTGSGYQTPIEVPAPGGGYNHDCNCYVRELPSGAPPSTPSFATRFYIHELGKKEYELTNHLGNVLATVLDRKTGVKASATATTYAWFKADVASAQDYYPFGSLLPGRTYTAAAGEGYRFGMNGQERDDEIYGAGNSHSALYWQYDARLGRRWNIDPYPVPALSSYQTFMNNPILYSDPFGDKVKNGFEDAKNGAVEKVESRRNQLEKSHSGIGKAIAKVRLARAESHLARIIELHAKTEKLIQDFAEQNPDDFYDLDNLTDENGTTVDAYVRIEYNLNGRRFSNTIGEMDQTTDLDGLTQVTPMTKSPVIKSDKTGVYLPVESKIYGPNTVTIIVDNNVKDKVRVLTHESGHAIFNTSKMLSYVLWLIDNPTTAPGGHGEDNPSGLEADRREREYLNKKKR